MGQAALVQWGCPAPTSSPPYLQAPNSSCHTAHSDCIGSDVIQKLMEATLGREKRASIVSCCLPPFLSTLEAIKAAPNFHASAHLYSRLPGLLLGAGFRGCAIDIIKATVWGKYMVLFDVGRVLKICVVVEATALELETRRGGWSVGPCFFLPTPISPPAHLTPSMVEFHTWVKSFWEP